MGKRTTVDFRRLVRPSIILLLAASLAVFMLVPSLAEGPTTWDRADFIPATGPVIEGLSASGQVRLAVDKALGIPEGITEIAPHAFQDLGLIEVSLPASLEKIGQYAFASNAIIDINLQDTHVEAIEENTFRDNALTAIELPAVCIEVSENAFVNNQIATLEAPGVTTIASKAFANNKLTTVDLPVIRAIDPSAFDTNGRVVAITANTLMDSHFAGGSGFIINPVTIRINYLNHAGGAPFRSPETLGNDFTSNNLYPSGIPFTIHAPAITGWQAIGQTFHENVIVTEGMTFDFTYRSAIAPPVITVTGRVIDIDSPAITQEMARSWATARSGVDNASIADIAVNLEGGESFPVQTDIERDVKITYRVTDAFGNVGERSIMLIISPGLLHQQIIPGKGWTYGDFVYGTGVNVGRVDGLSVSGIARYNDPMDQMTGKAVVFPGVNPHTGDPITSITTGTTLTVDHNNRELGQKQFTSIDLSRVIDLSRIENNTFRNSNTSELVIAASSADLTIGNFAFFNVTELTSLDLSGRTGAVAIGNNAFQNAPITDLRFGAGTGSFTIGTHAFWGATGLTSLDFSMRTGPNAFSIGANSFQHSPIADLKFGEGTGSFTIGGVAFESATGLTSLDFSMRTGPNTFSIGDYAFTYAPITDLKFGSGTGPFSIGNAAFLNAKGITALDFSGYTGTNAFSIGDSAFRNLPLSNLKFGEGTGNFAINGNAFLNARELTTLDLSMRTGANDFWVGASAFANSPITDLKFGAGTGQFRISNFAFEGARELTTLDFSMRTGPNAFSIGSNAFQFSPITELKFGAGTGSFLIGENAFYEARLTELDLSMRSGHSSISIGNTAFFNSPITELKFGAITYEFSIGSWAFWNARELTSLDFSGLNLSGVFHIGERAFQNSPITDLKFGSAGGNVTMGDYAFANASGVTTLDLSGYTGSSTFTIGMAAFRRSPLTEIKFGAGINRFTIGQSAFEGATGLTELDFSMRTGGSIFTIDSFAFENSPLTDLKFGEGTGVFTIGNNAFVNAAELTELDLSMRTGTVTINQNAFRSSPLTSLLIGRSNSSLTIGANAFRDAHLTRLDLSGRTGSIEIGNHGNSSGDEGAFLNSPLTELKIGSSANTFRVGANAFLNARLTQLDLSGRSGEIIIGNIYSTANDQGAFRNSLITNLRFGATGGDGIRIGPNAFRSAPLSELDLSHARVAYIGNAAFFSSTFDSLTIGQLMGSSGFGRTLYQGVLGPSFPPDYCITNLTNELPITILVDSTGRNMYPKVPGYILNPLFVTVEYVDGDGNELWPARQLTLQYPFEGSFRAQPLYGWMPDEYEKRLTVGIPETPQVVRKTIVFVYEPFDPAELGVYEFTLKQDTIKPYDLMGNTLATQFDLFRSDPASQDPFNDEGFIVRLYYDARYIQYLDHTPPREGGTRFTVQNDPLQGILSFTFPEGVPVGGIGPDIWWRLIPGYTQEDSWYPIHAQYEDLQGNVYTEANVVELAGYYLRPRFQKTATDYYADVTNSALGFDNPLIPSMTYNFRMLHPNPYSSEQAIPRWMESIVVTDELPTYTQLKWNEDLGISETITGVRASFDPAKNPGWVLLEDDITLEYRSANSFVGSPSIPRLVLDFPYAKPNTPVYNSYDVSMDPLNAGEFEGAWEGRAFASSWFYPRYSRPIIPPMEWVIASNKRPVNYGSDSVSIRWNGSPESFENSAGWFAGGELKYRPEIAWALTFTGQELPAGAGYGNVILRDHGLDERLMYTGVDMGTYGPGFIRAHDIDDNVIFEGGPYTGRVDFDPALREDIKSIELYGSNRIIMSQSANLTAYVFTRFIDTTVDHTEHPVVQDGGRRFENRFTMSGDILSAGGVLGLHSDTRIAQVYMRDLIATIGIHKAQSLPSAVIMRGEMPLDYTLRLDYFDEANQPVSASHYMTTIENLKIVDVLPRFFEYEDFVPAASFVNATTGLSWKTVAGGFVDSHGVAHDTLEITADTFKVGISTGIGRIQGTLSPVTPPSTTLYNRVYLDADPQNDARYSGGRVTTSASGIPGGLDNPFGRAGISMYETDLLVSSTREFVARKYIRSANDDSLGQFESWQTWKSTGVVTQAGAEFQYKLALHNYTQYPRYDIDIVDVLPVFDDYNITLRDRGNERIPRNSAFDNTLVDVSVPDGYHWEFITHEVPSHYNNPIGGDDRQSADRYFDSLDWIDSRTATQAQLAQATAIRIIYSSSPSPVLDFMDGIEVIITMNAQEDGQKYAGLKAWNSFAFRNTVEYPGMSAQHIQYQQPNAVWNMIPDKPARIELRKTVGTTTTGLAGAVFELYRVTDTGLAYVATATSQDHATATLRGLVVFEGLERGDYVIREVIPPAGYMLSTTEIRVNYDQFTDNNGALAYWNRNEGIFANTLAPTYGNLIIEKKDADGKLVEGIEFSFTPPTGLGLDPFTRKTDENGRIVLSNIRTGTWRVAEVTAPGNLRPINFQVVVNVNDTTGPNSISPANPVTVPASPALVVRDTTQGSYHFVVSNHVTGVNIHKIGVLSGSAWNTTPTSIDPSRHTSLSSVRFELFRVDSNLKGNTGTSLNNNVTVGTNGQLTFTGTSLRPNQLYYLVEHATQPTAITNLWDVTAQDPTLESNRHYFWVDAAGRLYNGNPYHGVADGDIPEGQSRGVIYDFNRVVVKNKQRDRDGWLSIDKSSWSKDESGNVVRKPLEGVTFVVEREDALTGLWIFQKELTTNTDGRIGPENFKTGTYRFFEKDTADGHLTDTTIRRFTVNATTDNQQFTYQIDNVAITPTLVKGNLVGVYDPRNSTDLRNLNAAYEYLVQKHGEARVHKMVNNLGRIELLVGLADAQFTIREYAGLSTDAELINTWTGVTSDADGTFMIDALNPPLVFKEGHTYTFQETKAPLGYVVSDRVVTYQPRSEQEAIKANGGKWITFDNRALKHRIVISKFASDTRLSLPGAVFELLHPDGTSVFEGTTFTSSLAGLIEFEGLVPGTYYLREVSAPEGYVARDNVVYRFVITGQYDYGLVDRPLYLDIFTTDEATVVENAGTSSGDIFWVVYNDPDIPDTSLTIEKTVVGSDTDATFSFQVRYVDGNEQFVPYSLGAYTFYEDETSEGLQRVADADGIIKLKHGQRAVIYGMSHDDVYHVEEIAVQGYRVRVALTDDAGTTHVVANPTQVTISGNDTVAFINTKQFTFPFTGGTSPMLPILIGSAAVMLAFGARAVSNRRSKHEGLA